jgi:serine protease Do
MLRTTVYSACLAIVPMVWGQTPAPPQVAIVVQGGSYLGVGVIEVNEASARRVGLPEPRGVEVANVAQGSPAEQAGLERGDVITKFRGETVQGVEHFVRLVRETPPGREVEMDVSATSGKRTARAAIGERRPAFARMPAQDLRLRIAQPVDVDIPRPTMLVRSGSLGATLESIDGAFARYFGVTAGVLLREVDPQGAAARAGLETGDVIVSIEDGTIRSTSDIRMALSRAEGEAAKIEVVRAKARKRLQIETGRRSMTQPFEGARQVSRPN